MNRHQAGSASNPRIRFQSPAIEGRVRPTAARPRQLRDYWRDHVDRKRVDECRVAGRPHEPFEPGQVGVIEGSHPGLQQDDRGESPFEHRHAPQFGREGGDVVACQAAKLLQGIADGAAHGPDRSAVETEVAPQAETLSIRPEGVALVLQARVDELGGVGHPTIL